MAEVVLSNCSAETGPSGLQMVAFVVDMAMMNEEFIGTALTEALARYRGGTLLQNRDRLDEPANDGRPRLDIAVDIVDGHPTLIFDAKYKAASPSGTYPNADHYQMLAYCTALKVPTAWLVYANGPRGRRRIVNSDVTVMEHSLDLSAQPHDLLAQVQALADAAWDEASPRVDVGTRLLRA